MEMFNFRMVDVMRNESYHGKNIGYPFRNDESVEYDQLCLNHNLFLSPNDPSWKSIIIWFAWWI